MKILIVLFLAICLSLSPSVAFCRDATKYSIDHNAYILESLSKEIYIFVAGLEKLEDNWPNRRHITTSIFNIIDKYNCDGKLYIVNRGLNAEVIDIYNELS